MGRVFVSHAVADKPLIDALVDLLQTGLDISRKDIFCTSLQGMKIKPGHSFVDVIKGELRDSDYVVMVVTAAYYESAFCLCELGATWVLGSEAFPLLVPPIEFSGMKAVLAGVQGGKIGDKDALNELKDSLKEAGLGDAATGRWEQKRDTFLGHLPMLLTKIPGRTIVQAAEFQTLQGSYEESQKQLTEQQEMNSTLLGIIEQLKACKDSDDVSRILNAHMDEGEVFKDYVSDLQRMARDMHQSALESVFQVYRGTAYSPDTSWGSENEWERIRAAQERGMVIVEKGQVIPDESNPKVKKLLQKLSELETFLREAEPAFIEMMQDKDEFQFSLTNRDFWKKYLSLR